MRPVLLIGSAIAAVGVTAGVTYVAVPGGGDEEIVQQAATASPQPSATAEPSTVTTPAPVPADWVNYSVSQGLVTLRHPPDWHQLGNEIYSVDPALLSKRPLPELIEIEVSASPDDGYGCGILTYDLASQTRTPEAAAVPTTVAGVPGWYLVRMPGDPLLNDPNTRIEAVTAVYKGYCFNIAAYFTQALPDAEVFRKIVSTLNFNVP
jgi:hypothetical protein